MSPRRPPSLSSERRRVSGWPARSGRLGRQRQTRREAGTQSHGTGASAARCQSAGLPKLREVSHAGWCHCHLGRYATSSASGSRRSSSRRSSRPSRWPCQPVYKPAGFVAGVDDAAAARGGKPAVAANGSFIAIDGGSDLWLGGVVTFSTEAVGLKGREWPMVLIKCWDEGGNVHYAQLDHPDARFVLGGGSSEWKDEGGGRRLRCDPPCLQSGRRAAARRAGAVPRRGVTPPTVGISRGRSRDRPLLHVRVERPYGAQTSSLLLYRSSVRA